MLSKGGWRSLWLGVPYTPRPEERPFRDRAAVQHDDELVVAVAVLDDRESDRFFGVPLARRGIQPVWVRITNRGRQPYRLRVAGIDPNYYPPLEAAFISHYRIGRRVVAFGLLALLFVHLLVLLPFKLVGASRANRRMDAFFQEYGIGWGWIHPGGAAEGFVFTELDEGTKRVAVKLLGRAGLKEYAFSLPVPGLRADHHGKELDAAVAAAEAVGCDEAELRERLAAMPRSTTNRRGTREGDPLNLVVVGDFDAVLGGFGARWDETETISLRSSWRTLVAFTLGRRYRYSPVSSLYFRGRSQDFALQKARETINERLHLRLWLTPLRFEGQPVWVGQVSRDIGVRFTLKTWNLTTHKIDPDVDDSRDYVLNYLLEGGRLARVGYVAGVGAATRTASRHNLTGDPYYTDGLRAVAVMSESPTTPTFLNWT
ncbi:MAG: LssY C-terminal domain-containing protein [Gemmataceae bacterium]|nr:LssY C-terminal domain-containing protein [Gemmataceae bacterium]